MFDRRELLIKRITFIGRTIRWSSWSDTKLIFLVTSIGIIILKSKTISNYFPTFVLLFFFFIIYGSFTSMINDYWDKLIDKNAGKNRPVRQINNSLFIIISILSFLSILIVLFQLSKANYQVAIIGLLTVFLAIFYSSPPIRLKEIPFLDVVCGSLIQRALPTLLLFSIFDYKSVGVYMFIGVLFLLGMRTMLMHQIEDYVNDRKFGVKTLITTKGLVFGKKVILFLYVPEIILVVLFSILFDIWELILAYLFFWTMFYLFLNKKKIRLPRLLFSMNEFFLSDFYYVWLPIYISICVFFITRCPLLILLTLILQKKHILIFGRKLTRISF